MSKIPIKPKGPAMKILKEKSSRTDAIIHPRREYSKFISGFSISFSSKVNSPNDWNSLSCIDKIYPGFVIYWYNNFLLMDGEEKVGDIISVADWHAFPKSNVLDIAVL